MTENQLPAPVAEIPNLIFFDTEFIEDGKTIDLVSIGMVRADGATYYAECAEADLSRASEWVKANVLIHLTGERKSRTEIARDIIEFAGKSPEFWAYYADYDWVALCQLYGTMMDLPDGWPMFCRDIKQLCVSIGNPKLPEQSTTNHHALADALWTVEAYRALSHPAALSGGDSGAEAEVLREELAKEKARADKLNARINSPETEDWMAGVPLEAAHQIERWGANHDVGKTAMDWFWLIGYLSQKAATSQMAGDLFKAKHHTISTAAALLNWHRHLTGESTEMRPGIDPVARGIAALAGSSHP